MSFIESFKNPDSTFVESGKPSQQAEQVVRNSNSIKPDAKTGAIANSTSTSSLKPSQSIVSSEPTLAISREQMEHQLSLYHRHLVERFVLPAFAAASSVAAAAASGDSSLLSNIGLVGAAKPSMVTKRRKRRHRKRKRKRASHRNCSGGDRCRDLAQAISSNDARAETKPPSVVADR